MEEGWIKLYRKITDHWLWQKKPFSPGQAWVDLLLLVNRKDEKANFGGKTITVKKGSRLTSIRILADRWGWSKDKTVRFLNVLERDKMLVKKSDTKKTVLTLVNYGGFQKRTDTKRDTDRTPAGRKPDTAETPPGTNKKIRIEEDKNIIGGCAAAPLPGDEERAKLIAELRR